MTRGNKAGTQTNAPMSCPYSPHAKPRQNTYWGKGAMDSMASAQVVTLAGVPLRAF